MERMLVVVFDNELKAYDGSRALGELDSEGSISMHGKVVIMKNAEGKVTVKQESDEFPIRTVGGTAIGALIGLLGGPVGLGIGALAGTLTGSILDLNRAGVDSEFIDDVSNRLTSGKWAIVADINEEWETPVDARMSALGGTVFRAERQKFGHEQHSKDMAAIKAHIARLKAEQAKAGADHKAKIQLKIDNLNKKLNVKLEEAKLREKEQEEENKAKVQALEKKAAKAKAEAKAKIEAQIADMKEDYKKDQENFDRWAQKNEEDVDKWMTGESSAEPAQKPE